MNWFPLQATIDVLFIVLILKVVFMDARIEEIAREYKESRVEEKVFRIPERPLIGIMDMQEPKEAPLKANDFSVAGRPRTVPWHIRRKELEAAARTKRKKRESFQEFV